MFRLLKPRILEDIRRSRDRTYRSLGTRVNLSFKNDLFLPLPEVARILIGVGAILILVTGSVYAPTTPTFAAPSEVGSQAEREALEVQLKDLEKQIDGYESQISSYQKQGSTLKGEITKLNAKISKLNLQIKAVKLTLADLDRKIADTESQIFVTEDKIDLHKGAIASLIRGVHQSDEINLLEIFLQKPTISEFFSDLNSNILLQKNLQSVLNEIVGLRDQLVDQKDQLSLARADTAVVKAYHDTQKVEIESTKREKDSLLLETKGQESKYQALLKKTKETAAEIRNRLFQLLGGGELTFEQAYQFAKLAGDATGVRPSFILAVLDRESALGQNVGRCKYNEISPLSGKTAMNPERDTPIFLEITRALDLNPESVTVSCPNRDGTYGGAMGPAQFIPSTWKLYSGEVSKITGRSPASPWNNADAFVAAALYLKDAGAGKNEKIAAARYYCGSRWNRYVCTDVYGRKVVEQAERFERDISAISA